MKLIKNGTVIIAEVMYEIGQESSIPRTPITPGRVRISGMKIKPF